MSDKSEKLKKEIDSFQNLWHGGTTLSRQGWAHCANDRLKVGVDLNKIYEICIKPYINDKITALEIGTNGGAWLKKMMKAKSLIGLDVLSAEHVGFWNNIPKVDKVTYHHVKDFSCDCLGENSIDYLFSYDVFCHISHSGTEEYLKNLHNKLKKGADCFVMIADSKKYQHQQSRDKCTRASGFNSWDNLIDDFDGDISIRPGRWYFYDTDRFCKLLEKYNYILIDKDVIGKYDAKSPIIHFRKSELSV
tara:strand:+ start:5316 stop:6059 length:744 start_codon:yes stop_codon:yes gene_type:complete